MSHHPSEGGPRPRVLCVDDNRDAADSAALLLQIAGFDARPCYDGPTALRIASEFHPEVCLLDLDMPGMDGDEVARRIRAAADGTPAPRLVVVTAMSRAECGDRCGRAVFDRHLVKPVSPGRLFQTVDDLRPDAPPA